MPNLLSFTGTDTIPTLPFLEKYYNANLGKELIGGSVPATEHSVMCMGGDGDETSQNKIAADTSKKLDYLTADITEIQADISSLLTKLNTTNEELTKAEEKIDETEQGKVKESA